ncbi:thermonuclease family protein [Patescibacteria group bacterium]|nr:thermonuclease family protein [Patescibacteria group bacterium]MCG2702380.1 thermonuclease family protein [Candidatus Parcubacteria bacterium]MBU4264849.1 thermonuclease family protein [Patescibacteria group bacterium]MBU4389720.1 thermonuclease family protein [Patescibacteria group bacterium]MBU4397415.1 thermonuclease family protein [Patescibacteria group bacterium]
MKGNKSFWLKIIGGIMLVGSLVLNVFFYSENKRLTPGIKVIGVIDGDTIVLDGKVRLRLRQVDAPELEFCGGKEAKEKLEELVGGEKVVLEEKILDQMGRDMALVYVKNKLINEELLAGGWVKYHSDSTSKKEDLKKAGELARKEKRGIFGPECRQMENLENPECVIKGNIDPSTQEKKYYLPGCVQYKFTVVEKNVGEKWFCSEKEAQEAGYVKSKRCPENE